MSWLWSSSKPSDNKDNGSSARPKDNKEAFTTLDPSLKDYFKNITPEQKPTAPVEEPSPLPEPRIAAPSTVQSNAATESNADHRADRSAPHALSAYGDRYAEYWATYKPYSGVEGAIRADTSDQKLKDFVDGYKQRRANVGKAAIENCAFEELELRECYSSGTWWQRIRMCTEENHKLNNCIDQQAEFLKALGYLQDANRDPMIDERIQMHADKLYHQQKAQDEAAERARKESKNVEEAVAKVKAMQALEPQTPDYTKLNKKSP